MNSIDRDDVGVVQLRHHASLALEPLDQALVEHQGRWQDLDRDQAVERNLSAEENGPHSAASQLVMDLVLVHRRYLQGVSEIGGEAVRSYSVRSSLARKRRTAFVAVLAPYRNRR